MVAGGGLESSTIAPQVTTVPGNAVGLVPAQSPPAEPLNLQVFSQNILKLCCCFLCVNYRLINSAIISGS